MKKRVTLLAAAICFGGAAAQQDESGTEASLVLECLELAGGKAEMAEYPSAVTGASQREESLSLTRDSIQSCQDYLNDLNSLQDTLGGMDLSSLVSAGSFKENDPMSVDENALLAEETESLLEDDETRAQIDALSNRINALERELIQQKAAVAEAADDGVTAETALLPEDGIVGKVRQNDSWRWIVRILGRVHSVAEGGAVGDRTVYSDGGRLFWGEHELKKVSQETPAAFEF